MIQPTANLTRCCILLALATVSTECFTVTPSSFHAHASPKPPPLTVTYGVRSFLRRKWKRRRTSSSGEELESSHAEEQPAPQPLPQHESDGRPAASIHYYPPEEALSSGPFNSTSSSTSLVSFRGGGSVAFATAPPPHSVLLETSRHWETTVTQQQHHQTRGEQQESSPSESSSLTSTTSTALAEPLTTLHSLEAPLYTLPPVQAGTLSSLEQEFRDMLEQFSSYSRRDILSLRDENVQILFEGVAASAHEPAVYRAFEVLFEDLYPLRVASRVIYKKLRHLMQESQNQRQEEVDAVVQATGLEETEVEATWLMFVSIATKINHDAYLTQEQLVSSGFLDDIRQVLHPEPVQQLLQSLEQKSDRVTFPDFIIGLHECANLECSLERQCDSLLVLQGILQTINSHEHDIVPNVDPKKRAFARRYNEMLDSFKHWKDLIPEGSGRRLDVVRGCFVGAENEKVVQALRICYVDYSGLRMAAEIIFKLVNTFMASRERAVQASAAAAHQEAKSQSESHSL